MSIRVTTSGGGVTSAVYAGEVLPADVQPDEDPLCIKGAEVRKEDYFWPIQSQSELFDMIERWATSDPSCVNVSFHKLYGVPYRIRYDCPSSIDEERDIDISDLKVVQ
jgi:hypothetical protein